MNPTHGNHPTSYPQGAGGVSGDRAPKRSGTAKTPRERCITHTESLVLDEIVGEDDRRGLRYNDLLYLATVTRAALEEAASGEAKTWSNPDTGSYGSVTVYPSNNTVEDGYCREVLQTVVASGR